MSPESWRILLVDDDAVDRMAVRRALTGAGVTVAIDERERADEVYALLPPPGDAYDCVVLDCHLPGVSGLELVRELRSRGVGTPILAITGHEDEDNERALISAGASDYLPKSEIRPATLLRRLRYAIRVGRAENNYGAALESAQRAVQDRDDLLSIVSHDLRNPLNAIRIASDELADPTLEPGERKMMVAAVQRALRRADRLIQDLLDVSRIESGRLQLSSSPVPIRELLEQARGEAESSLREAKLELKVVIDPAVGPLTVDRDRVVQVLDNLIGNATRYARGTGAITLEARRDGDLVELAVEDKGPGIKPEELPHLFDRFYQVRTKKRAGAGLGLAIAKGIAEAHGGRITAKSTLGQGSRFSLFLPQNFSVKPVKA